MNNNSQDSTPSYVDQLTWFRGIAAFFVIVSHITRATEVKYSTDDQVSGFILLSLLDLGSFGVVLFLVLSGCTLYISNSDKTGGKKTIRFYIKRFFRIWPAFVVSLCFYIGFTFIFSALYVEPRGHWIEKQFLYDFSLSDIFLYLTLVFNITGPGGIFNNAYWSLPVEFQYYLIFPFLIISLRYLGIVAPLIVGGLLYLVPRFDIVDINTNTVFTLALSFCGGVVVGYIYTRYPTFRINTLLGVVLLVASVAVISLITNSYIKLPDLPVISNIWNWYIGVGIVTVFVVLTTRISVGRRLESILEHYGTISYSTYLYHNLFIGIAILVIINYGIYDADARLLITLLFTLAATHVAAGASYRYIEKPFISMGRQLANRF